MKHLIAMVVVSQTVGLAWVAHAAESTVDLSGPWSFKLDPQDVGVEQQWYSQDLPQKIRLPGSLQEQGYGNDVSIDTQWTGTIVDRSWYTAAEYEKYRQAGNVKIPFWLQPDKHYVGSAWYQRVITIPEAWHGKRITLSLERCHWETTVWVDGKQVGSANLLSAPHVYDLTYGPRTQRVTVRVDNRVTIDVGENAHSVSDHTQSNWNGIVGHVELRATDRVWIDDVQVYPDVDNKSAKVKITVGNLTYGGGRGTLAVGAQSFNSEQPHVVAETQVPVRFGTGNHAKVELDYPMGDAVQLWGEFQPVLYRLNVKLRAETREMQHADAKSVTFGMRKVATKGTQFVLNGRPIFLRGTLECCIFPLTGYPPTDVDAWKRIIGICKAHGLNHMRFHSHCPPEAAFVAADQLGFYLQVECGAWAAIGNGKPIDRWLYDEAGHILREYGNHPSFVLMAYGNEPSGNHKKYLAEFVNHWKAADPRRLYTSAAGWPVIPASQFHNPHQPRVQRWGAGLRSRINASPPETVTDYRDYISQFDVPVVSHEIGQWCVYPNFEEIPKYTGTLKAKNFEIFRDTLQENHMGDQAHDFLMASGKLQTLCYKEEIESALRTPGFGGFQLLDLHDFPGQGTALVGVLDPFWDSKPYVTPAEFRRFCSTTVPLARLSKRTFMGQEPFTADVDVAHFGPTDLSHATVTWRLVDTDGQAVESGRFNPQTVATGQVNRVGRIETTFDKVKAPYRLTLIVAIEGTAVENDWDLWVYPPALDTPAPDDVLIVKHLSPPALERLQSGGQVLLMPNPKWVNSDVAIGFSSIFWNTAWTRGQAPHTLGILCDPDHPALAEFPTEYHSNWQWWELVSRSGAMILDDLPPKVRPIVQVIDTWFNNRRLGLVFEGKVGEGKLLVCSMDLESDLDRRPVARQMRHSLLTYMAGSQFDPKYSLTIQQVRALLKEPTGLQRLGAKVAADSQQRGYEAARAIDGDPVAKPNVIFLMDDQHRWDALGIVNSIVKTPNLDALAKSGIFYDQAVCQAPMCTPSRNSMMLGLYPNQTGVLRNGPGIPDEQLPSRPLPELFRDAGYQTAGFGKTHWGVTCSRRGFETRYIGQCPEKNAVMMIDDAPEAKKRYDAESKTMGGGEENNLGYLGFTSPLPEQEHRDGWVTGKCLGFIDSKLDAERPLFLYLSFLKPHAGHNVPAGYEKQYDLDEAEYAKQPPWKEDRSPHAAGVNRRDMYVDYWSKATDEHWRLMTMRYRANCTWIDDMFGRVLRELKRKGVLDNAIIVYCSDHGEMLGERFYRFNKYCLYESSVRVPLILSGSAIPEELQGTTDHRPAELVDLYPTLLGAAGITIPQQTVGMNLLSNAKRPASFSALHERRNEAAFMWRTADHKLILRMKRRADGDAGKYTADDIIGGEFYNLAEDPQEWHDLYSDPTAPRQAREIMTRELLKFLKSQRRPTSFEQRKR